MFFFFPNPKTFFFLKIWPLKKKCPIGPLFSKLVFFFKPKKTKKEKKKQFISGERKKKLKKFCWGGVGAQKIIIKKF